MHVPQEHCRSGSWGRRLGIVAPAALALTFGLGTVSAIAAPAPAATAATAATHGNATPNLGVGQGKSDANLARSSSTSTVTTDTTTPTSSASTTATDHVTDGTAATVGNPKDPQPLSNADTNTGGANGQCSGTSSTNGIYCSTRDGSPSPNGNGASGVGKPCEACVGKADNKNPPGQEKSNPMGTFPNNGYECDHNNGIGKGNPAHSGCTGTTTQTCPPGTHLVGTSCITDTPELCPNGQPKVNGECPTKTPELCPNGQPKVNGECPTNTPELCPNGQPMVNGSCSNTPVLCPNGQPMVNGSCTTTPVTPSTGGTGGTAGPGGTCPSGQVMAGNVCTTPGSALVCPAGTHMEAGSCVLGEKVTRTPTPSTPTTSTPSSTGTPTTTVLGERVPRTPSASTPQVLPFTGGNFDGLLASGLFMALVGLPLMVAGRRRRRAAA